MSNKIIVNWGLNNKPMQKAVFNSKEEALPRVREYLKKNHIRNANNKSWFELLENDKVIYKASLDNYRNNFTLDYIRGKA